MEPSRYCSNCHGYMSDECYIYKFLPCIFEICIECTLRILKEGIFKHDDHPYPLMFVPRKAEFYCNICDVEGSNFSSYVCTICSFWIHNICAFLPATKDTELHDHLLLFLAFCFSVEFHHYNLQCDIYCKAFEPLMWIYYYGPCHFFIHVKCHWKTRTITSNGNESMYVRSSF